MGVILFRGLVCSGKTVLAKSLVENIKGATYVYGDLIYDRACKEIERLSITGNMKDFDEQVYRRQTMRSVAAKLQMEVMHGQIPVIDWLFLRQNDVNLMDEALGETPHIWVSTKMGFVEYVNRNQRRPNRRGPDFMELLTYWGRYVLIDNGIVVDTENQTQEQSANEVSQKIRQMIDNGAFSASSPVT